MQKRIGPDRDAGVMIPMWPCCAPPSVVVNVAALWLYSSWTIMLIDE
jgi:hypothetical protein